MKLMFASGLSQRLRTAGFSLVEVTLAIGIVSFSLISLLGLFAVGLESGRQSESDTVLAEVADRLFNDRLAGSNPVYPDNGRITVDGEIAATGSSDGVYLYEIALSPVTDAQLEPVSSNLNRVMITFRWPAGAQPQHQKTQVYLSGMVRPSTPPVP